ncbi:MAG: hypothetical protein LBI95_02965, partial [Holosporales bacterium]|nr:hypothetical protein [Holosporales bacterium]
MVKEKLSIDFKNLLEKFKDKDLELVKEKLSIDDEGLLDKFNNLKSMDLEEKSELERNVIWRISSVAEDKLNYVIENTQTPTEEKLQYLGVKAVSYISKANGVGIKWKVYNLREKIEVAIKGSSSEEDFNSLKDD